MKRHSEVAKKDERFKDEHLVTRSRGERAFVNERTIFKSQSHLLCHDEVVA